MARGEIEKVLDIDKDKLFDVIVDYESYPEFVSGVKEVSLERLPNGKVRAHYFVSMIKDITYTVELTENRDKGTVEWSLVEGSFFKRNDGGWQLTSQGDGQTLVKYWVDIDFAISVPGFILKKLVSSSLPSMIEEFEERAREELDG